MIIYQKKKTIDVVCTQKVINVTLTFTLDSSATSRYRHFYNIAFDNSALIESGITSITVRCPYSATQISYCDLVYNKSGSTASYRLTMSGSNVVFDETAISRLKQYNGFQLRVVHHAS